METDRMIKDQIEITETRTIRRISYSQMVRSMFDAFNLDRGAIFTLKQLFVNPGRAIVSYLGAGRYRYVSPFRLLIVTTAVVLYLISISKSAADFETGFHEGVDNDKVAMQIHQVNEVLLKYMNLVMWTFIPLIALHTYLPNRKRGFNYAEHLVFHTYLFSIANIFAFLLPLDQYLPAVVVWLIVYLPMVFYYIYGYRNFMCKSWLRAVLEMAAMFGVSMLLWGVAFFVVFLAGVVILSA